MAINKVDYGDQTLIDLTEDSVTPEDVLNNKSFHDKSGELRSGTASYPVTDVQVNGTSVLDGTVAKVIQPTSDKKTATDEFTTANGGLLSKCQIDLVPVQSGSGDPYPAGGGKNKYNNTATTNTIYGVTFTVNDDGSVLVNGTATEDAYFYMLANGTSALATYLSDNVNYIVNGCPSGGSSTSYRLQLRANDSYYNDGGNGQPFTYVSGGQDFVRIHITSGYTANNLLFKPMIRLSTETDPTFAPYSNVRPISGHTEVDARISGLNLVENVWVQGLYNTSDGKTLINNAYWVSQPNYYPIDENETFTISATIPNNVVIFFYDENKDFIPPYVQPLQNSNYSAITTPENATFFRMSFNVAGASVAITPNDMPAYKLQLEKGNQATAYEPYLGHLYTINLGGTYYGGYLDVVSGEFVPDTAYLKKNSVKGVNSSSGMYYWQVANGLSSINGANALSSHFKSENRLVGGNCYIAGSGAQLLVVPADQTLNTKALADAWMADNEPEFVYKLANPTPIQLTPQQIETLAGQNNLSCPLSGQSIETNGVEYKELFTFADVKEYVKPLIPYSNAGSHNAIYRGKYLGSSVSADQWTAIQNGTFDDLFIGDYWTINSVNWRIAHFDYWLGTSNMECTDHHVVIVPDTNLYSAKMNSTDITTGGYYISEMRGGANYLVSGSSNLYTAKTKVDSAFGSAHILTHREILTNAVSSGNASGWAWYDSSVDLMSEVMVYGTLAWSNGGKGYEVGDGKGQLALFRHDISKATNRANWWLRSVASATGFAIVNSYGCATYNGASSSNGVRPCFAIK